MRLLRRLTLVFVAMTAVLLHAGAVSPEEPDSASCKVRQGAIGSGTQQKRICQLSFVNCHLGARQVGSALGYFTRSERDQDRTGQRFAAAR